MAMSSEDISLLHDHDESLTEEQLQREIEHLNAELGKFFLEKTGSVVYVQEENWETSITIFLNVLNLLMRR
jgi:sulfite reductase alpha subunit-like flavoprotein